MAIVEPSPTLEDLAPQDDLRTSAVEDDGPVVSRPSTGEGGGGGEAATTRAPPPENGPEESEPGNGPGPGPGPAVVVLLGCFAAVCIAC